MKIGDKVEFTYDSERSLGNFHYNPDDKIVYLPPEGYEGTIIFVGGAKSLIDNWFKCINQYNNVPEQYLHFGITFNVCYFKNISDEKT